MMTKYVCSKCGETYWFKDEDGNETDGEDQDGEYCDLCEDCELKRRMLRKLQEEQSDDEGDDDEGEF